MLINQQPAVNPSEVYSATQTCIVNNMWTTDLPTTLTLYQMSATTNSKGTESAVAVLWWTLDLSKPALTLYKH